MTAKVFDRDQTAAYYDDQAVSRFYETCWGGADIHIGRYDTGDESVAQASAAMTQYLIDRAGIMAGARVLDIACGFGGTLIALAQRGCTAKGIDISQSCINRARASIDAAGLSHSIDAKLGDFHNLEPDSKGWDAVVCQEAIIHSTQKRKAFEEVFRVLKPGGTFAFSDIVTGENADLAKVEPAFLRLGAVVGVTIDDYQHMACEAGFEISFIEERLHDIQVHYEKLAEQLRRPIPGLDDNTIALISGSIDRWRAALANGDITWACFVAKKPG